MKKEVIIREIMKTNLIMVKPSTNILEAAKLMKKNKIGNVIVVENNQPIGIITVNDIIRKVVAEGKNSNTTLVEDAMSTPIVVADPFINLEKAMKIMGKFDISRLPVVENGKLIGIITQKDILRVSPILHEISQAWHDITMKDESYYKLQIFSGKCEDCNVLSTNLRRVDGRILCEDCIDALNYE